MLSFVTDTPNYFYSNVSQKSLSNDIPPNTDITFHISENNNGFPNNHYPEPNYHSLQMINSKRELCFNLNDSTDVILPTNSNSNNGNNFAVPTNNNNNNFAIPTFNNPTPGNNSIIFPNPVSPSNNFSTFNNPISPGNNFPTLNNPTPSNNSIPEPNFHIPSTNSGYTNIFVIDQNLLNSYSQNTTADIVFDVEKPKTVNSILTNVIYLDNISPEHRKIIEGNRVSIDRGSQEIPIEYVTPLEEIFPGHESIINYMKHDLSSINGSVKESKISKTYLSCGDNPSVNYQFKPFVPQTEREKLFCLKDSFDKTFIKHGRVGKNDHHYTGAYLKELAKRLGISSVGGKDDLIVKISKEFGFSLLFD